MKKQTRKWTVPKASPYYAAWATLDNSGTNWLVQLYPGGETIVAKKREPSRARALDAARAVIEAAKKVGYQGLLVAKEVTAWELPDGTFAVIPRY